MVSCFLWNVFGVGDVHWKTVCENVEGGKLNVEPIFFIFYVSQFVVCEIILPGHRKFLKNKKNHR
jgi:hypothetical protein